MLRLNFNLLFLLFIPFFLSSQIFTKKDSLRGELSNFRSCYDVTFYNISLTIDDVEKSIERSYNEIYFVAIDSFSKIQIDLFDNMEILYIDFEDESLNYSREFNAVFIDFPRKIMRGENVKIKVWYTGIPTVAKNPPWDGGFTWDEDLNGNPWIGVSCQGIGASLWWPCKDHQSDEPDSMRISIGVRKPLIAISNGNLIKQYSKWDFYLKDTLNIFEWFVSYPINNYGFSINIGDYEHFNDVYIRNEDTLDLSYYVLPYNIEKASDHFKQVIPMLECFEYYFGNYPFSNDGFALVETPYLGMEHQSGIAYGNDFLPGYKGNLSYTAGLDFDYIIVHEAGHEWWGNSITTNDIADMWIHEGFCTYSESLYVECMYGYESMIKYIKNQRKFIKNEDPIVCCYNVNYQGSGDMYHKGSLILHTLRTIINNDELWFSILRSINTNFQYKTINGDDVINLIVEKSGIDFTSFFNQYLNESKLPEFQYKLVKEGRHVSLLYRWDAVKDFSVPMNVYTGKEYLVLSATAEWQEVSLGKVDIKEFRVLEDILLVDIKKLK